MSVRYLPPEILERARIVIQMAGGGNPVHAAEMLNPWAKQDTELFVQVMLALALMADPDRMLKEGHAAYTRGDRSPAVVTLERRYQRLTKRKNRAYNKTREGIA